MRSGEVTNINLFCVGTFSFHNVLMTQEGSVKTKEVLGMRESC